MNYYDVASDFLKKYHQHPENVDIDVVTNAMVSEMRKGLDGKPSSLMMIPTYLSTEGNVPLNEVAGAIDAGGTNIRVAAVSFTEEGLKVERFHKQKMLGTETPLTKQEFLDQLCELILPIVEVTDKIGFCFSFPAEIMPNKDGKVIAFCKEVNISGCEGMLLGEEINANLKKYGVNKEVKFVVLNDTVSTLLGGPAVSKEEGVDGQIGLILGTGTNTAYTESIANITKINGEGDGKMIINMESGIFDKAPQGTFDKLVDEASANKGDHIFEKMISGVYLGNVIAYTVKQAAKEGLFSLDNKIEQLPYFTMVEVDAFLRKPFGDNLLANACANSDDTELLYTFCDLAIERASKLVTCNLAADMVQMDGGKKLSTPTRIVIEGSTYHKCFSYKEKIDRYMKEYINDTLHRHFIILSGDDVNLAGSGQAALLNL